MSYYPDLSEYSYSRYFRNQNPVNIGWLDAAHQFSRAKASVNMLDLIWQVCSISVARSRGGHFCELCEKWELNISERHGKSLILGGAEIRVFSLSGKVYAAPNLIFHYVEKHDYLPPQEFVDAIISGPLPPQNQYFKQLEETGMEWADTTPFTSDTIILPAY